MKILVTLSFLLLSCFASSAFAAPPCSEAQPGHICQICKTEWNGCKEFRKCEVGVTPLGSKCGLKNMKKPPAPVKEKKKSR